MIISIDESGDFREESSQRCLFVAVHIRQLRNNLDKKRTQFEHWEHSLPRSLKNHNGEIKSSVLSDDQLLAFSKDVLSADPIVGITAIGFQPSQNPKLIVDKHKLIEQAQINDGIILYSKLGRTPMTRFVTDMSNWFRKLGYDNYVKAICLGNCIIKSVNNAFGHAIAGDYTDELLHLRIKIDKMFLRGTDQDRFWHHLLKAQIYTESMKSPLPLLRDWQTTGHPVLDKYWKDGHMDLKEVFWKNCSFNESHHNFEIRIADAVNTILSRYHNRGQAREAFEYTKRRILRDGTITGIVLRDVDVEQERGRPFKNPYEQDFS